MEYLVHFVLTHQEFRFPELLSVCECLDIEIELPKERDTKRPLMVVRLNDDETAHRLASRCILIKAIYQLWAHGHNYEELHAINRTKCDVWSAYKKVSFKFNVTSVNQRIPPGRIKETIDSFSYMGFEGCIDMKNPRLTLVCLEDYEEQKVTQRHRHDNDAKFLQVFFGRLVSEGESRPLIRKFDVKKRAFFGNTTMEAEISLLMANQAQATPGKMIYDPFVGTGSMLYTAAQFGAYVLGSDLDGRQMRGKGMESVPGIYRAADQYGLSSRVFDLATFDVTKNPWRCGNIFDAIVTDPPYGVRAGAKRLGRKDETRTPGDSSTVPGDGQANLRLHPPMKPYELSDLTVDLIYLARYLLKPGGRLVFFLPTVNDEYDELDIPECKGMELVSNSLQDFGKWGRRLITMVKITTNDIGAPRFEGARTIEYAAPPAHHNFRVKYFEGFQTRDRIH
ncbi:tRNA guanosine-2'-O-methyltransferase [Cantharellus anzutake]|uniref:tRNA guanosine-2'-O-methyltransferase n=1 Tax=Cantharellus anzutake TaxID=1750568 RepID=UPI001903AB17|nr:tRNA guanosine-2'-O-methyltransferase [Cantharellus anzutake]KAF8325243.1 tRNA guanosine-2'-O-methyltransferase [Cantharellus anzutake]